MCLYMHVDGKQFLIQLANDTSPVAVDLHFFIDGCAGLFSDDISLPFVLEFFKFFIIDG